MPHGALPDEPERRGAALRRLAAALAAHRARVADDLPPETRWAAVLLLLREAPGGEELLLIRRAERAGDPWSGHVALPGGRRDAGDASLEHTALRETWEEVGLDVGRHGRVIGVLDDVAPRTALLPPIAVRPFVGVLHDDVPIVPNAEVAAWFWVPLASLLAEGAVVASEVAVRDGRLVVPSFVHEGNVVWGMTERILQQLLAVARAPGAGDPLAI